MKPNVKVDPVHFSSFVD